MTGPSTNFYVGPQKTQYTIPKRLIFKFSDFAKACLDGQFSEAGANAVFLPDVDPDVFQHLWLWLYSGEFGLPRIYEYQWDRDQSRNNKRFSEMCRSFCRVHFLAERLAFDIRFLKFELQNQLEEAIELANSDGRFMILSPETVQEVLSETGPVVYDKDVLSMIPSLRPFLLRHLCTFNFCTTVDFVDYADCFEKDGAFAAEIMIYLATEIRWAKERWEEQVGWPVDVFTNEEQEDEGSSQCIATRTKLSQGVWVILRRLCNSTERSVKYIRIFSNLFEMNGAFAAEFLNHLVTELLLTIERWGYEREETVDFAKEKEEDEKRK